VLAGSDCVSVSLLGRQPALCKFIAASLRRAHLTQGCVRFSASKWSKSWVLAAPSFTHVLPKKALAVPRRLGYAVRLKRCARSRRPACRRSCIHNPRLKLATGPASAACRASCSLCMPLLSSSGAFEISIGRRPLRMGFGPDPGCSQRDVTHAPCHRGTNAWFRFFARSQKVFQRSGQRPRQHVHQPLPQLREALRGCFFAATCLDHRDR